MFGWGHWGGLCTIQSITGSALEPSAGAPARPAWGNAGAVLDCSRVAPKGRRLDRPAHSALDSRPACQFTATPRPHTPRRDPTPRPHHPGEGFGPPAALVCPASHWGAARRRCQGPRRSVFALRRLQPRSAVRSRLQRPAPCGSCLGPGRGPSSWLAWPSRTSAPNARRRLS